MKKKINNIMIAFTAAFVILTAGCSENGTDKPNTSFKDTAVTSNSSYDDTEATVNDTAITAKSTADTTSATEKGSENNYIKPNSDAYDDVEKEMAFLAKTEQLVNSVEEIEELKRLLMEIERVTDVQVYNSADDVQNTELQITEGKAAKGMIVKIFYDNGECWVEYTKQDENKDNISLYPPDYYSQTIPPQEKNVDFFTFTANPKVFSCTITDNSLTDSEKNEAAAKVLAEEYIKDFCESSDKYPFRILDYQNVTVNFLEHTVDRSSYDYEEYSIANGIGDMEVSENAWVIDIDAQIKFSGSFGFVSSEELDGENVWNHIPVQGMSEKYLLYRQDDIFYLWSRDVYHYER